MDLLAPSEGRIGEVIDLRDSATTTLGTGGSVYFGSVRAAHVLKWTPSDIYVEVPAGISGTVTVSVKAGNKWGGYKNFLVRDEDAFPRVMSFGDSVTYWGAAWVANRIEEDPYLSQFAPLHLNHGRRGEKVTEPGAIVRWQDALQYGDCEFAVLMHGINDLTDVLNGEEAIPLEAIRQGLVGMIDAIALTGKTLILCTLPPRVDSCGDVVSPTTEELNAWLRSYAAQEGIPLVDVYEDFVSTPDWAYWYFGGNCLHPVPNGYMRIAELVNEKILEIYLPGCTDLDGDGYGSPAAPSCSHPEPDCKDSNPNIHPGVVEAPPGDPICSDGLDNDCDGDVDLGDTACRECTSPEDCDDGLWCNGQELCVSYACEEGVPPDCDDEISCTEDACNEAIDACENLPNDALCEDGNPCTGDTCHPATGCVNACNAVGPEDPCCEDPACTGSPVCDPA